jgi:hypothetical protein
MKALSRINNEDELSNTSSHGGVGGDGAAISRRSGLGVDPVRRGSITPAATTAEEQAARRAQRRPSSIEGGALAGVVDRQPPSRPKSRW